MFFHNFVHVCDACVIEFSQDHLCEPEFGTKPQPDGLTSGCTNRFYASSFSRICWLPIDQQNVVAPCESLLASTTTFCLEKLSKQCNGRKKKQSFKKCFQGQLDRQQNTM